MGWIKRRINKEESKHGGRLDWALIAEKKIVGTIMDKLRKIDNEFGEICLGNVAFVLEGKSTVSTEVKR